MAAEEENGKTLAVQTFEGVRRYGGDFNSVSVLHVSICLNETRPLPILGRMTNLRSITLQNGEIRRIKNLKGCVHLEFLDLTSNRIAQIGTKLRHNQKLKTLILDANPVRQITPEEGKSLSHLNSISLRFSHIHNLHTTANSLANAKGLRYLRFKATAVPNASNLERALYLHRHVKDGLIGNIASSVQGESSSAPFQSSSQPQSKPCKVSSLLSSLPSYSSSFSTFFYSPPLSSAPHPESQVPPFSHNLSPSSSSSSSSSFSPSSSSSSSFPPSSSSSFSPPFSSFPSSSSSSSPPSPSPSPSSSSSSSFPSSSTPENAEKDDPLESPPPLVPMSPPLPLSSPRLARMSAEPVPAAFQLLNFVNSLNNYGDDNDDDDDDDDDDFSEEGEFFEEEFEEDDDANSYEFVTPISHHYFYRAFLIAALPQITTLDGVLITKEEQEVIKPILPHIECLNTSTDWQRNAAVCRRAWQTGVTHQFLRKSPQQAGPSSSGFSAKDLSHKEDVLSVEQEKEKHSVLQELSFSNSGNNGRNACVDFRMAISSSLRRVVNRPSVECFLTAHSGSRVGVPRQFEYHPRVADEMVVGTMSGDIILLNPRASSPAKRVKASWSSGVMESILGLGWLKRADNTQKFIAGSDQGAIRMMNTEQMGKGGSPVSQFEKFPKLTSLSCNSQDDCFMVSGYSKSIALYDMNTGAQTVFDDLHDKDHINVLKFANTHPSLFVTSSFDHYVKMWDLRTDLKAKKPVYSQRSENGTLMACFSDDDRYILGSAVDNEVTQYHAFTGQKHFRYPLSAKGSNYNYTRSYYMQGLGGDYYTIVGSCDDNVVHIFNSETGAFFRDVELTTPTDGWDPHGLIYCQSLRGDPFVPFNLSVLVNSNHVYIPSRLLHIDLMKSDVNEERRESKEKGEEGWDESSDEEEN